MNEYLEMLVKLAHGNPNLQKHLMPVFKQAALQGQDANLKTAGVKTAFKTESEQFVAWCLMKGDKWTAAECQRLLDRVGVPMQEGTTKQTRGPLSKGEMVKVQESTNANPKNADLCHQYDGLTGAVTDVDGDAVVVTFDHGKGTARFDGVEPGKKTGLGRWTPVSEGSASRAVLEVIYISEKNDKPPSKLSVQLLEDYIEKGFAAGESRADIYHSGVGLKQAFSKEGQYYFTIFSQQRDIYPRTLNPPERPIALCWVVGQASGWLEGRVCSDASEANGRSRE